MKNIHLFLRDGKWFGNEFPEIPISLCSCNLCERRNKERHEEALERAKSEALEIVNPQDSAVVTYDGEKWYLASNLKIIEPGVLYPWDGGVRRECNLDCQEAEYGACFHPSHCQAKLRLLPKSPVIPEGSKTVLYKEGKFYGDNTLEIENPLLFVKCFIRDYEYNTIGAFVEYYNVIDGNTFPLPDTLEWEVIEQFRMNEMSLWRDCSFEDSYEKIKVHAPADVRQVLRLKEKAVVKDDRIFIDGDFNDSYEARIRRSKGRKAVGTSETHEDSPGTVAIWGIEERGEQEQQEDPDPYKWPAIQMEKALRQATEKHNPAIIDGKSDFALGWRLCLRWVEENYFLNSRHSEIPVYQKPLAARSENAQSESHNLHQEIAAHEEYEALLIDEINSLIGTASVHGWKSQNVEKGAKLRDKINALKSGQPSPQEESQDSILKDLELYCINWSEPGLDYEETQRRFTITRKQPTNQ